MNGFDVDGFADQLGEGRVGWVPFCVDDHFLAWHCAPSEKFNAFTGYGPGEKGSRRDLIAELADALDDRGIRLILYLGGMNGYVKDPQTMVGLSDDDSYSTPPSAGSRKRHLEILGEYSTRYGEKVAGWWFDMFKTGYEAPPHDVKDIRSIVRAGNPNAVIAFALNGPPFDVKQADVDNYTGGDHFFEVDFDSITPERQPAPEGVLWHAKIFCGDVYHGQGTKNRFSDQQLIDWISTCNRQGGVCTLDWPFDPKTGLLKEFGANQLKRIREAIKGSESGPRRSDDF